MKLTGYLLAVFTVMMWSMNLIYAKYLAGRLTPEEISFYRWAIAVIAMFPFVFHELKNNFRLIFKHLKFIFIMALSGIGGLNLLVYHAGYTASATDMSLISILGPVFLVLLSHQRVSFLQTVGIFITIFGVVMIILNGRFNSLSAFHFVSGDVFMLGSAFLFALYSLSQQHAPQNMPPLLMLFTAIFLCAAGFGVPVLVNGSFMNIAAYSAEIWTILIILGVVNSFLAYLCWDKAMVKIGAVSAGALYYTMPVFTMLFSYLFLGDKPDTAKILGMGIVCIGVLMIILPNFRTKQTDKSR